MDLSNIKMVVTDMDGTLLNSDHEVSDRFFELFYALQKRDVLFVAASGRQYNSIIDKLLPIKDDIIVIAENGAFVMHREKELLATPMDRKSIKQILATLEGIPEAHTVLCGKRNAYINDNSTEFGDKLREYYSDFNEIPDIREFQGEVLKIAVYHFKSSEEYIYPSVRHLENGLKVKVSGAHWLDLSHQNAHKGFALQQLQKTYNIGSAETLVFGDYNNDLEMMALSDYSFAMANAHENVLKAAKYTTTTNDDLGVERVLEKLLLG